MNYSEQYELRERLSGDEWLVAGYFDSEAEALKALNQRAQGSGAWRVVRCTQVTVANVAKA